MKISTGESGSLESIPTQRRPSATSQRQGGRDKNILRASVGEDGLKVLVSETAKPLAVARWCLVTIRYMLLLVSDNDLTRSPKHRIRQE